ncbi:MAG TPA: hypothetical protein VKU41_04375 [Polyangiaceae bacterium]|nr:hypothetical protein [Polyangiaceae bacterium]
MSRRLRAAALVIAATVVHEARGRADTARSQVAIVRPATGDRVLREANTRLRAELLGAGFDVVEVDRPPGDGRSEVDDADESTPSFATVAINRAPNGAFADVWISDHVTRKTVVRRLEVGSAADATAVLAIRALELLRASLLEVVAQPPPSSPPAPAPPDVARWVAPAMPPPPRRPVLRGTAVGVGVLTLHGLGGIGLAAGPMASLSRGLGPMFVRLTVADLLVGPEVDAAAGSATVRQELGALTVGWASEPKPIGVQAWMGAGGFDLQAQGSAAPPYRPTTGVVGSFLWTAGVGGVAQIGARFALTADVSAVFLDPKPVVVIAGRDAGGAGAPSVGASVGALVGL